MRTLPIVAAALILCGTAPGLVAQSSWTPLPMKSATKLWADSNSWVRYPNGFVSVRLRTVEARVDGQPSESGAIQYMDFDCPKQMYRVRRTEFVKGEKVYLVLPDSSGSSGWLAPNAGFLEDLQLKAACSKSS